jgi:hypothetical protein
MSISANGLNASINYDYAGWPSISVQKGFIVSVDFPGPVLYYFEVINRSSSNNQWVNFLIMEIKLFWWIYLQSDQIFSNPNHNKCSKSRSIFVGLSSGNIGDDYFVGRLQNSYAIRDDCEHYWLSGKKHPFEWPNQAIKPKWKWTGPGDVIGCGLLLNPANKELSIFFTGNGLLLGQFLRDSWF